MHWLKVTPAISKKIGIPVNTLIEYDRIYRDDEMISQNKGKRIAVNVFYNGKRIGGRLNLDTKDEY